MSRKKNTANPVILSYHNSLLHNSDLDILRGPHWLNDQLISFYFEFLENGPYAQHRDRFLFVSPEVTQCLKLVPANETNIFLQPLGAAAKRYVFFPLNDHERADSIGGCHWSLLVYAQREECFYAVDSSANSNDTAASQLCANLSGALSGDANRQLLMHRLNFVQQRNGYDCGVHVLYNAIWLAEYLQDDDGTMDALVEREHEELGDFAKILDFRAGMLRLIERLSSSSDANN